MEQLFLTILRMSLSACPVILAVLLVRLLLTGAPKKWSYFLWSVVGFRLICPVSFQAAFSLFSAAPIQMQQMQPLQPMTPVNPVPVAEPAAAPIQIAAPEITESAVRLWPTVGIILWCVGMAALVIYSLVRVLRLRSLLLDAVIIEPGVWQSDRISTPFLMGLIHPKIYIPTGTDPETTRYVLAHERVHLSRGDHWIKLLAFLILTVHWFNPLCWLAFLLMNRDMELSCDERVLAEHGGIARAYSLSLLHFAAGRRFPGPGMLAFGEPDVKRRIQNVLHWQQPKRWATILAALLCTVAVAACAANPINDPEREAIKNVAMEAGRLSVSQSAVVDTNGQLIPGIEDLYEQQLGEVFTEDSGYIRQYADTMRQIVEHFNDDTDVLLDHQITDFKLKKLKIDGDQATAVCRVKSLQRYIPHREDGYAAVFTASRETVTYTLLKGTDGIWRVKSFDSEDYLSGTPLELGMIGNYKEKVFPTRAEACQYAASIGPSAQEDTNAESAAIRRLMNLQAADIQEFISRFSSSDPAYNDALAAAIRNAAGKAVQASDEDMISMPWYWAELYLSKNSDGGISHETIYFQEELTAPVVYAQYQNPETKVSERLRIEDETLYWLIRNNFTLTERVELSALALYWDPIHSRAADTVQRDDFLTGYDITSFYKVDTLANDVHTYDVYYWCAAYDVTDPYMFPFAGGAGLDSQGRVIGLNEEECYFIVREDGACFFTGFDVPFGFTDDESIRARALELLQNAEQQALSQGINHP